MFADDLLLLSGQDIPFPEAQITIHPPTLKEIGLINERNFFIGIDMLNFSKNKLSDLDKSRLEDVDDFEIFMSILGQGINDPEMEERINAALFVLSLIFPDYQIAFQENAIVLQKDGDIPKTINVINFKEFKQLIVEIFCLNKENANTEYNPGGPKAKELAEKFKKRREKLAKQKGQDTERIAIYSRYASILAVALRLPLDQVLQYTVYQINDQMERYELFTSWEFFNQARMAGATGMDEPENWMKDLKEKKK